MSKDNIQKQLEKGRILVYGLAENEEIKARIAPIYPDERIEQGKQKYMLAKEAIDKQVIEGVEATQAHKNFKSKYDEGVEIFRKLRKVGRYFFSNDTEKFGLLRLNVGEPRNYAEWRDWAKATVEAIAGNTEI